MQKLWDLCQEERTKGQLLIDLNARIDQLQHDLIQSINERDMVDELYIC